MIESVNPPSVWPLDDGHLWQKLVERNDNAWAYLQAQLLVWVSAHLRARLHWMSHEQIGEWAGECTQAACLHILARLHLYRGEGPLLGWCRVVSINVTNDWMRRDRRDRLFAPSPLQEESGPVDDSTNQVELAGVA